MNAKSITNKKIRIRGKFKETKSPVVNKTIRNISKLKDFNINNNINVACILDEFSYECFKYECNLVQLGINNWKNTIKQLKPQFLFVESAWLGFNGEWAGKIANINMYNNKYIKELTEWCNEHKIPTVFWAKEDPNDFNIFIDSAKYFDYVFTTDFNCMPKYKKILNHNNIYLLPFAAQPRIHNPVNKDLEKKGDILFAGGWYKKFDKRKDYINMLLIPAMKYDLNIYDRFYRQNGDLNKFPEIFKPYIKDSLPYNKIVEEYKKYKLLLNVNSVDESPTTFSRRVFEVLASGIPIVSSYSLGIKNYFDDIVLLCKTKQDVYKNIELILKDKESSDKISLLGQRKVFENHTYKQRFEKILNTLKINYDKKAEGVSVITCTKRTENMENVFNNFLSQSYSKKELIVILNNDSMNIDKWIEKAKKYKNIKIFQLPEEKPLGSCLNFAVDNSKYECISKFDDDDYYAPNYLVDMLNAFKYTNAHILGKYSLYAYLEDKKLLTLRYPNMDNRFIDYVAGSTLTFKKEVFEKVRFRDLNKSEDTNFLNDSIKKGFKIYATDRFNHVVCRRNDLNDHSWKISETEFLKNCKIITKTNDYKSYVTV